MNSAMTGLTPKQAAIAIERKRSVEALLRLLADGKSERKAARRVGISTTTARRLVQAWKVNPSLEGLAPKLHGGGPKPSGKLTPEQVERVQELAVKIAAETGKPCAAAAALRKWAEEPDCPKLLRDFILKPRSRKSSLPPTLMRQLRHLKGGNPEQPAPKLNLSDFRVLLEESLRSIRAHLADAWPTLEQPQKDDWLQKFSKMLGNGPLKADLFRRFEADLKS